MEITVNNLNDNIDKGFLSKMIAEVGEFDELNVYYHPINARHLGLARVVFQTVKVAKACIEKFNGKSVMGRVSMKIGMSVKIAPTNFDFFSRYCTFSTIPLVRNART